MRPALAFALGLFTSAALLAGCATYGSPSAPRFGAALRALPPGTLLLLGEQHDADDHQRLEREAIETLAAQARLAVVVLEMVERGHTTDGLPRGASEREAQERLQWNAAGWPWERYGPVVMAAVRAGVPVRGGNLPRAEMGAAMRDATHDRRLPPEALQTQYRNIREGHCGLLPETQIPAMARIQVARDRAMAAALGEAAEGAAGRVVLLVAGGQHILRDRGVPVHLTPALAQRAVALLMVAGAGNAAQGAGEPASEPGADRVWRTPAVPPRDHCAELRARPAGK